MASIGTGEHEGIEERIALRLNLRLNLNGSSRSCSQMGERGWIELLGMLADDADLLLLFSPLAVLFEVFRILDLLDVFDLATALFS